MGEGGALLQYLCTASSCCTACSVLLRYSVVPLGFYCAGRLQGFTVLVGFRVLLLFYKVEGRGSPAALLVMRSATVDDSMPACCCLPAGVQRA